MNRNEFIAECSKTLYLENGDVVTQGQTVDRAIQLAEELEKRNVAPWQPDLRTMADKEPQHASEQPDLTTPPSNEMPCESMLPDEQAPEPTAELKDDLCECGHTREMHGKLYLYEGHKRLTDECYHQLENGEGYCACLRFEKANT